MKYVYKQHNKWGNPQQRPPPQPQEGPGWGLLYKPQPPRTTATPGTAANSLTPTIGEKEANRLRDRLKEMLSRHLHRDPPTTSHSGSNSDTPPQDSTHQPHAANPALHDQPTDPASSTTHDPTTADVTSPEAAAPDTRPSGTESAAADPAHHDKTQQPPPGESPDPRDYSHDNAHPPWEDQLMQDWYDTQAGDFAAAYDDLPPKFPYRMPVWGRSHNFPMAAGSSS